MVGVRVLLATPLALDESLFHPIPSPYILTPPILILSAPSIRLFSIFLSPLPVPSIPTLLQPAAWLRVRSLDARITMRSKACIAYPDWYNNGRMYECVCMWLHMGPQGRGIRGMAKVRTHGRTTPIGEEGEDENGARFLPRARSCWNTAAPYVASLYTVERVTARYAAPSRAIPPAYF